MNAESTAFRASRPAVAAPGGEGARAAAWWAARQKVAVDKVQSLQQRRISATETQVLVVAQGAGSQMPSGFVTVRKGPSGWKVQ